MAEAARNVACVGAVPIGATNCLNFGNPESPEIMWQFIEAVDGIGEACRALDTPSPAATSASTTRPTAKAIYPTPVIGMVGLIEDASTVIGQPSRRDGDAIVLLGESRARTRRQRVPAASSMAWSAGCRRRST